MIQNPNCVTCFNYEKHCAAIALDRATIAVEQSHVEAIVSKIQDYGVGLVLAEVIERDAIRQTLLGMDLLPSDETVDEIFQESKHPRYSKDETDIQELALLNSVIEKYWQRRTARAEAQEQVLLECPGPDRRNNARRVFSLIMRGVDPCSLQ